MDSLFFLPQKNNDNEMNRMVNQSISINYVIDIL